MKHNEKWVIKKVNEIQAQQEREARKIFWQYYAIPLGLVLFLVVVLILQQFGFLVPHD